MKITKFYNSDFTSNTYLLEYNNKNYVIDPGSTNMSKLISYLEENKIVLDGIVLTHGHFDHINGIPSIIDYKIVPIYIYEDEKEFLFNKNYSLLLWGDLKQSILNKALEKTQIITLKDGEIFNGFEIIHTPGHTKGGMCLYNKNEKVLISGDTMFRFSHGRIDLPTGNKNDMWRSLEKLLKLEKDTLVYPGHGDTTTILDEYSMYNPSF